MGMEFKSGQCGQCQQRVKVARKGINHILHLLLTIVTAGLWLFIWVLIAIARDPWRCDQCGSKSVKQVR